MALKGTANQTGFEMAQTSPVFDQWIASYDGLHPLLDIGCAYGLNVAAAAERLRSEAEVKVVACDCAEEHLRAVDELKIAGVKTIFGRLPDGLEALQKIALECGGVDGLEIFLTYLYGQKNLHVPRSPEVFHLPITNQATPCFPNQNHEIFEKSQASAAFWSQKCSISCLAKASS